MSEIQSLTSRADDLRRAIDVWNTRYVWFVALGVLFGVLVFLTQYAVIRKSRQLVKTEADLSLAKEHELALELKDKDRAIQDVKTGGETEAKRIETEGKERIAKVESEAGIKIAEARRSAARLEVEALNLRRALLRQGPRANLIAGENRRKLVDALKPFAKQRIDVRHLASVTMVNGHIVQSAPIGDDTLGLANTLAGVLKEAGWDLPSIALPSRFDEGQGITVEILHGASPDTKAAAKSLVAALKTMPLAVNGPSEVAENFGHRVGKDVIWPAFDENTIVLDVLVHP